MLALSGVGEVKLARFGTTFLRAVAEHRGADPDARRSVRGC
jgi:hypothetical protein